MKQLQKLSKQHIELIRWLVANPHATQAQAEKEFGWCHSQMSQIYNSQIFKDEYDRQLKEKWKGLSGKAVSVMNRLLDEGDYKAAEFVLKSNGYQQPEKIELELENTIKINISDED